MKAPMPSAISRPSEPVETVSTSRFLSLLPSRMIEPLPKLRSIWESAASRAFDLSMDEPSTRRSADADCADWAIAPLLMTRIRWTDNASGGPWLERALYTFCSRFAICSFLDLAIITLTKQFLWVVWGQFRGNGPCHMQPN